MGAITDTTSVTQSSAVPNSSPQSGPRSASSGVVDAVEVLRQVLALTCESDPTLDVKARLDAAIAHPDSEVVDSLGAVSVVCMLYDAYSPENLIPANLLTHRNFTTLGGLRKVIAELNKRKGTQ